MKILWLCNSEIPVISEIVNNNICSTIGWLDLLSRQILRDHDLTILFPAERECNGRVNRLRYHMFKPDGSENMFEKILIEIQPDIVHIWGTEFAHSLKMITVVERCSMLSHTIISIQGLVSMCSRHYTAGLPNNVINGWTIRDLLRIDNIYMQKRKFAIRGMAEEMAIKKAHHIIGRTDWDYYNIKRINPQVTYYRGNETMRESFYDGSIWDSKKCERHSLFMSQAGYPIKGLHYALEGLYMLKSIYPDVHLFIGGERILERGLKISSYAVYAKKLINKWNLNRNVTFLGYLDAEMMKQRYLLCNAFLSSSSIENSSNSIAEAMLLGTPVISSDVGGIKNFVSHGESGFLYPADEPYMIAFYAARIFEDIAQTTSISIEERKQSNTTHDPNTNYQNIIEIYRTIGRAKK
jgi:glycosyltransferase involved in cell wall biosynthesis